MVNQFFFSTKDKSLECESLNTWIFEKDSGKKILYLDCGHTRAADFSAANWTGSPIDNQLTTCYCDLLWIKNRLSRLGITLKSLIRMYCDKQAVIHIAENLVFHKCTKYIEVACYLVRQKIYSRSLLKKPELDFNYNKLGISNVYAPHREECN